MNLNLQARHGSPPRTKLAMGGRQLLPWLSPSSYFPRLAMLAMELNFSVQGLLEVETLARSLDLMPLRWPCIRRDQQQSLELR